MATTRANRICGTHTFQTICRQYGTLFGARFLSAQELQSSSANGEDYGRPQICGALEAGADT